MHASITQQLKFHNLLPLNPFEGKDIPCCEFPWSDVYMLTIEMLRLETAYEDFLHSEGRTSWMNEYHMQRNFTNPIHIEALLAQALKILGGLKQLSAKFQKSLKKIYYSNTIDEWCGVYLSPKIERMSTLVELARNQEGGRTRADIGSKGKQRDADLMS